MEEVETLDNTLNADDVIGKKLEEELNSIKPTTLGDELVVLLDDGTIEISDVVVKALRELNEVKEQYSQLEEQIKQKLLDYMIKTNRKSYTTYNGIVLSYKPMTTRNSLDTTRIKTEIPEVYRQYLKSSAVSESLTIKLQD